MALAEVQQRPEQRDDRKRGRQQHGAPDPQHAGTGELGDGHERLRRDQQHLATDLDRLGRRRGGGTCQAPEIGRKRAALARCAPRAGLARLPSRLGFEALRGPARARRLGLRRRGLGGLGLTRLATRSPECCLMACRWGFPRSWCVPGAPYPSAIVTRRLRPTRAWCASGDSFHGEPHDIRSFRAFSGSLALGPEGAFFMR